MHIEPGIVDGAKIALSYGTAIVSFGLIGKMAVDTIKNEGGIFSLIVRSLITTLLVFCFFEILPHRPVGVSEVHFIFGSTLFLLFGSGAASIGLGLGLLMQGLLFAPFDLPQYGMNLTTLVVPLYLISLVAKKAIPANTAYTDITYTQALKLSTAYQGGIVMWVGFWAFYGQGFGVENLASVASFSIAYMGVVLLEPLLDLAVLAAAKSMRGVTGSGLFNSRLHHSV